MKKTTSGFVLVGGIVLSIVSAIVAVIGATGSQSPSTDALYDGIKYAGFLGVLGGAALFFYGSMLFARK